MRFESPAIDDAEMSCIEEGNHPLGLERRQRAAHGLDWDVEVVRDIVARHRQGNRSLRLDLHPMGQLQQESAYSLQCMAASQQNHSRLQSIDRAKRDLA